MNDLFSGSFSGLRSNNVDLEPPYSRRGASGGDVQMRTVGVNLDKFFEDVEGIKDELKEVEALHRRLQDSHEESMTLHNARSIKDLRARMDADVALVLKKAKMVKIRLEALDRANAAHRSTPGCGPGSSSDRTRTSVVSGLRKKLKDQMENFNTLREKIATEYKETVEHRYFTVTGEKPDKRTVDALISTGQSENLFQKMIQEQGRGTVMDIVSEIQERQDAVKEIEKNLKELHQVFLDMAVLVQSQGEQLDDIESQVARATSFIRGGTEQLQVARTLQKNTRKWACFGITILLIIIIIIVIIVVPKKKSSPAP
ncbi:PREDICTED: syntaxin-121-like [Nelumbo nucifera]|uniref:Syntaxin-121-like n=2 Tax=Nelumbo nucifera TaxID=4432 RepID=A0A1U8A6Z2_NELNU|nr:PREDICTED: syntaxin-121-like [Nelumbo nucifera]DAD28976.1 TPA_asm: hypothetical protein HUJ06_030444 [Nelumbo nucifera]